MPVKIWTTTGRFVSLEEARRDPMPAAAANWLALAHLVSGVLLCLTIIGIPLGLANFKLIPVSLLPLGREIVSVEQARSLGVKPMFSS